MADLYKPDDFSLFLHQILLGSTSAPSVSGSGHMASDPIPDRDYFPTNVSYSPIRNVDNDEHEHECESEDMGFEAVAEDAPAKRAPSRNSSKRSRAAEVHNLSEKRRRSRINEKMKALQNLIPNSNKTDKASMLDEAIEYLKQLQLQVQMLTMRNGLSLYPMCLPGVSEPAQLSPMNLGFLEQNGPINLDLMGLPHVAQETSTNAPNQNTDPAHLPGREILTVINSGTSLGPAQLHISSVVGDIFREDVVPHRQLETDHCQRNLLALEMAEKASTTPNSCEASLSNRENYSFEACALGSRRPDSQLVTDLQTDKEIVRHFRT